MPKIIENLKQTLMLEAKHQLETLGYSAMTIRSVAKACGVGVGTVYNYFTSKEALLATLLLGDWNDCISSIQEISSRSDSPTPVLRCMYEQLIAFAQRHQILFQDTAAIPAYAGSFIRHHKDLRSQLSQPLRKFCSSDFSSEFIAESMLTWSMSGKTFEEIHSLIAKLF